MRLDIGEKKSARASQGKHQFFFDICWTDKNIILLGVCRSAGRRNTIEAFSTHFEDNCPLCLNITSQDQTWFHS